MSEEKIINSIKPIVNARKTHKDNYLYSLQLNAYQLDRIADLLDLYNKEKEKRKYYEELFKQNKNREKIKTCMTHNMPNNAEIICMIREDFERNFGNDYISKDKIREKIKEYEDTYMISDIAENGLKENYKLIIIVLQELLEEGE